MAIRYLHELAEITAKEVIVKNPSDSIGFTHLGTIHNHSGNSYVRGSIIFTRNKNDITWSNANSQWTRGGGSSNDFSAILHTSNSVRFLAGPAVSSSTTYTNTEFLDAFEYMRGTTSGHVTFFNNVTLDSGILYLPDGSVSAPSISNTGDTNTGMYWPGDHQLGFSVNGSRKFYMSSTQAYFQNLSAGVSISAGGIDVTGDSTFTGDVMPAAENAHNIGSASVRWEDLYVDDGYIRNAYIDEYVYHNGDTDTNARFQDNRLTLTSGGGAIVDLHSNGSLYFTGDAIFYNTIKLAGSSNEIIKSDGSVRIDIDNNNNQTDRIFIVSKHNAGTELFRVNESGNGTFSGSVYATDFVDADDVNYFVDPDWNSVMSSIDLDGFISHNGYTTTKFGFSNNHEIKFTTNNNEVLKLDSSQVATFKGKINITQNSGDFILENTGSGHASLTTGSSKDLNIGSASGTVYINNNTTFSGGITIEKSTPTLTFNNLAGGGLDPILEASGSNFNIKTTSVTPLSINLSTEAATFAGTVRVGDAFTLPSSIGSAGQVLKVPSSGTTLEWGTGGGGATVANDANDRITTAVGDGTLNAESNLTFNGSTLGVTGNVIIDSSGSTDNYYLTMNESGSNRFTIYENSNNVYFNGWAGHTIFRPQMAGSGSFAVIQGNTQFDTSGNATFAGDATVNGGDLNLTKQNGSPYINMLYDGTNPGTNTLLHILNLRVDYDGTHQDWGGIEHRTNASAVRTDLRFNVKSSGGNVQTGLAIRGQASAAPLVGVGTSDPDAKVEIIGNGRTNSTTSLRVRSDDDQQLFYVRDDGVVSVTHNYFYVDNPNGMYSNGKIFARGGVTDDGGDLQLGGSNAIGNLTLTSNTSASFAGDLDVGGGLDVTGSISAGPAATGGGVLIRQNYSGSNYLGVISSHNSNGNLIIGHGAQGKVGSSGYVSTYGNFSGGHSALEVKRDEFLFKIDASDSQTAVGSDVTLADRLKINRSGTYVFGNSTSARLQVDGDVKVMGSTDLNIQGSSRRLNFTSGTGTVRTTTSNNLILATNNLTALTLDTSQDASFEGNVNIPSGYVGRDSHNGVYFSTDDSIIYRVADSHRFRMDSTTFRPYTDSTYDLGTASVRWANIYTDAISVLGTGTFDTINTGQGSTEVHLMNQNVRTTDNVEFGDVTVTGNLYVTGTSTTVNVEDLNVEQGEITLNYGTGDTSAAANGAGIRIQDAVNGSTDALMSWNTTGYQFNFSHGMVIGGTNSSNTVSLVCKDAGVALLQVGDSVDGTQGTGAIEVTQDGDHGGGISYNGDGSPTFASGESADHITFFRNNNGTRTEVFSYPYNSNNVTFNGGIVANGGISGLTLANGGITGTNYNISGVNQLTIADPGEGIVFGGGQSGNITLAVVDDNAASDPDSIVNLSGAVTEFRVDGKIFANGGEVEGSTGNFQFLKAGQDNNGFLFSSKTVSLTENTFVDALTVNMDNHEGCYVKITAFGDWSSHSSVQYLGEFFLTNGAGGYGEPGMIIREVDNTQTDSIVAQIVDPSGTSGARDFVIQLKADDTIGSNSVSVVMQYEVRGHFNSVT